MFKFGCDECLPEGPRYWSPGSQISDVGDGRTGGWWAWADAINALQVYSQERLTTAEEGILTFWIDIIRRFAIAYATKEILSASTEVQGGRNTTNSSWKCVHKYTHTHKSIRNGIYRYIYISSGKFVTTGSLFFFCFFFLFGMNSPNHNHKTQLHMYVYCRLIKN